MSNTLDPKDLQDIRNYVEEFERQGNDSRVRHLRLLINEIDRLQEELTLVATHAYHQ
jgi:Ni,Fe-hydrogenase III large subunit